MRDATATAALLLPGWVRVVGALLLLVVAGVLAAQAARARGPRRTWHGIYAGAALGMALMFAANPMVGPGPNWAAYLVMLGGVAGLVLLGVRMVRHRRETLTLPWLFAVVDLVILVYIQVPSPSRPILVCVLLAMYLAVQVGARATSVVRARKQALAAAPERSLVGAAVGPSPAAGRVAPTGSSATAGAAPTAAALGVLALSMLYMIMI